MTQGSTSPDSREDRLGQILAEYLEAKAAKRAPKKKELIEKYPEYASDLEEFFADSARFEKLIAPLRIEPESGTTKFGGARVGACPTPPKIRYFGDYELVEEIARGGMGVVYRARQISLNRPVALKMILAGQLASEDEVRRFH